MGKYFDRILEFYELIRGHCLLMFEQRDTIWRCVIILKQQSSMAQRNHAPHDTDTISWWFCRRPRPRNGGKTREISKHTTPLRAREFPLTLWRSAVRSHAAADGYSESTAARHDARWLSLIGQKNCWTAGGRMRCNLSDVAIKAKLPTDRRWTFPASQRQSPQAPLARLWRHVLTFVEIVVCFQLPVSRSLNYL